MAEDKPKTTLPTFTPVPRKRMKRGGWSAERQREFIELLAETGSVRSACRRMGVGEHHIYKLRRLPGAESFRKAWEAALDIGMARIEDVAMDRAINGVEQPVYHRGELVGARTTYNDSLLMFMLRNRSPQRFVEGTKAHRKPDAISQMQAKQQKKKWREEWEAEQQANATDIDEVRASINRKVEILRRTVYADYRADWMKLTAEARRAYGTFETLRARDLGRPVSVPFFLDQYGEQTREDWWNVPDETLAADKEHLAEQDRIDAENPRPEGDNTEYSDADDLIQIHHPRRLDRAVKRACGTAPPAGAGGVVRFGKGHFA